MPKRKYGKDEVAAMQYDKPKKITAYDVGAGKKVTVTPEKLVEIAHGTFAWQGVSKVSGNNVYTIVGHKPIENKGSKPVHKIKPDEAIDEIIYHMRTDGGSEREDKEIKHMYSRISSEMRNKLDNFFIFVTGYSLGTIIKTADAKNNTIASEIIDLHDEDDRDVEKESYALYHFYERLPHTDKQMIDYVLVRTSGYEMNSLLSGKTRLANKKRPTDWNLPPNERRPDDD